MSPQAEQLSLGAGALGAVPVSLNQSGLLLLSYNSSGGVDFYVANRSAFAEVSGENGTAARVTAMSLEGRGVYAAYENSSSGAFPYPNGAASPSYAANVSALPAGTYYAVFGNRGSGEATIVASYTAIAASSLSSTAVSTMAYGGASFLLLLAGMALAVASLFMKEKASAKAERLDEEARLEYDRIEKESGGRPRKPKAGSRKRSR